MRDSWSSRSIPAANRPRTGCTVAVPRLYRSRGRAEFVRRIRLQRARTVSNCFVGNKGRIPFAIVPGGVYASESLRVVQKIKTSVFGQSRGCPKYRRPNRYAMSKTSRDKVLRDPLRFAFEQFEPILRRRRPVFVVSFTFDNYGAGPDWSPFGIRARACPLQYANRTE